MIINKPWLCTKIPVWNPKWSGQYADEYGEPVALLHRRKVDFGSPVLLVEFTKSKSLAGQRFCIKKEEAQRHKVGTNGRAEMYEIPLSHFESWQSAQETLELIHNIFD